MALNGAPSSTIGPGVQSQSYVQQCKQRESLRKSWRCFRAACWNFAAAVEFLLGGAVLCVHSIKSLELCWQEKTTEIYN